MSDDSESDQEHQSGIEELRTVHEGLPYAMRVLLVRRLKDRDIFGINVRQKSSTSAVEKLTRKGYERAEDITDYSAIRVITYFSDEVDRVCEDVAELLPTARMSDRRVAEDPKQFWYRSVHFEGEVTPDLGAELGDTRYATLPFEIQVRSLLEHMWAEIEHRFSYKGADLPEDFTRRFALLAAHLETAEDLVLGLRDDAQGYLMPSEENCEEAVEQPLAVKPQNVSFLIRNSPRIAEVDRWIAQVRDQEFRTPTEARIETLERAITALGVEDIRAISGRLEWEMDREGAGLPKYIATYNRRDRVKNRPVFFGESVLMLGEYLALKGELGDPAEYFKSVHPRWSETQVNAVIARLTEEVIDEM